ncbi:hypothetical protein EON65_56155 [archaeon]|nr:MAG: hypothetical protein EON65_56155 [archaeon]
MTSKSLKRPRSFKPIDLVSEGYDRRAKRLCSNPIDRLCDLLLPWDFYGALSSPSDSSSSNNEKLSQVPLSFSCYHHYISVWEPLMLEEMRQSILSTFQGTSSSSSGQAGGGRRLTGHFQFSLPDKLTEKSVTLQGMFTSENDSDEDYDR